MRNLAAFSLCLPLAFATACTISDPQGGTGASSGSGGGGGSLPPPPGSYSLSFGPVTVQPGTENTQCVVKRLGNPDAMHVGQIHNVLHEGSHHLIVYRTNDTMEQPEPFDCQPFVDTLKPEKGSPLMITQKTDELLTLPQGVAFSLAANQMVRIEMHYINTGDKAIEVHAESTFIPIAEGDFKDEADFLFIGDPDIKIQAHSKATVGPVFFKLPAAVEGGNYFGITGHTHQWGTNVTVAIAPAKDGPDTPVYDVKGWQWKEPATVYQDPPFTIPSGGGFRFSCEYDNLSTNQVGFGESANDEMCFFWAYYYPSKGAHVCAHTDQFGGFDLCCPGNPLCNQVFP